MFKSHKGQISIELFIFFGIALLFFLFITAVVADRQNSEGKNQERYQLDQIANQLQQEIYIAASVQDGYTRTFSIPQTIQGKNYTPSIYDDTTLSISVQDTEVIRRIFPVIGQPQKGENQIRKNDGQITLN